MRLRSPLLLLVLPLVACIEDRLSVDLSTQIHRDGTCTRRVTYRLERVDTDRGDRRIPIPAEEDPLHTLHRFPSGEPWYVEGSVDSGVRSIVVEATLPSPDAFDGDYSRARNAKAPPARNYVSGFVDPDEGVFEYHEVLRDPVSLLAALRVLAHRLPARDGDFAGAFLESFPDRQGVPSARQLSERYLEDLALPLARDVASIARRPVYGVREQRAVERVLDSLDGRSETLAGGIAPLVPDGTPDEVEGAVSNALDRIGESLAGELESSGLFVNLAGRRDRVRFRATVVMPFPIARANTCAQGDTAVWEFDGEELGGNGFEMRALALAP